MNNSFLEKVFFPLGDLLLGTSFSRHLHECRKISNLSEEGLYSLQNQKLSRLLTHAISNSSYYRSLNTTVDVTDIHRSLKQFPILTKDIVRREVDNLLTKRKEHCIQYNTSGSSGVATRVYVDKEEESIFRAILICWWEWTGYRLGDPILQTGMTMERGLIKSVKDFMTDTTYINAFNLTHTHVIRVLKKFENTSNCFFGGYASSLYVIAKFAEEAGIKLKFKSVISWGDKMFEHYKETIERVFDTKVYENYACNEGIMIGQKVDLPYYYIFTPNVFVELLDENWCEVEDGKLGRVVVTKLDGYAMPLIRYYTGDLAIRLPRSKYPEIRRYNFPLLQQVIGRDTDLIYSPDGSVLIVHTFTGIFAKYHEIKQFKVVQTQLDTITIEYIPGVSFKPEILSVIEKEFFDKTSSTLRIEWRLVFEIQPSKSGKPQIIQNDLVKNGK